VHADQHLGILKWLPHKLRDCSEPFQDPEVLVCVHTARLWYGDDRLGDYVPYFRTRRILSPAAADPLRNYLGFANLFRRQVLDMADYRQRPRHPNIVKGVGEEPHTMVHDQWIWFVGSMFGKVAFIPEVHTLYRQHAGNTVGFTFKRQAVRERFRRDKATQFAKGAEVASECASFAEQLSRQLPGDMGRHAAAAAQAMRRRATIHQLRSGLYGRDSSLLRRGSNFLTLVGAGGYRQPSASRFAFGPAALLKDLLIGVPGTATRPRH
jgi:hypothetical protein